MIRKSLTLVSALLALFLVGSSRTAVRAQSFQYAQCNGVLTEDLIQGISTDVMITNYISSDPTVPPQLNGSIYLCGFTGPLGVSFGADVQSASFSNVTINKAQFPHIVITTVPSLYQDMNTGLTTMAFAQVSMTQYGKFGQFGFKIYNAQNGALLAQTSPLRYLLRYKEIPLFNSDMQILF